MSAQTYILLYVENPTASAAFSLSDNGAADGLKPEAEVIKFYQEMC